ncbi:MAG TPA: branched-chain amino acid ABC transporter permease [Ignavibacteria bacterium]|nr:branched-chain amino acid ABC transporter permease [Bacteroidota bacterium]HRF65420.1 branched-chain amino acid ABC transporter permease [Ignavibacteria bacterium]HRJ04696.1 branched-chain amino acid ABC transporter permease [Ignavibacteria bacterium]HRJ84763.1 branched-chain amino acid ABC transporter permease [Ignavibacteria bacterium]
MTEFIQQVFNGLSLGSIYALIALGYTMIYGILRFINFAHGDVFMIGAFSGYYLGIVFAFASVTGVASIGMALLIMLGAMVVTGTLGFTVEKLVYKPLRKSPKLTILITAIGVSLFLEYGGQLVFGADPKSFPSLLENKPVVNIAGAVIGSNPLVVLVTAGILMVGLRLIVMKTKIGTAMRAVSYNPTAASLMGININAVISFTFIIGSSLAGAAGILYGLNYPSIDPLMGILPGLKAFVAAVLGGIGNIPGAALGGMIIGLLETFVTGYISPTYRDAIAFGILILILLFKPTGLLGKKEIEKV